MNQGAKLVKLFVNANIRKIENLDILLTSWDKLFNLKYNNKNYPNSTVYYYFFNMMLTDEMKLRIINDFVYFQSNDIVRMSLNQFPDVNNSVFLLKWFLIFETQKVIDSERSLCDYEGCLFNNVLDQCFPRFQICARYMCLSMRQACNEGVDPMSIWHDFNSAVVQLLLKPETMQTARRLLDILYNRHEGICITWNPKLEVYPGSNNDK
jgi:hypothetical protein